MFIALQLYTIGSNVYANCDKFTRELRKRLKHIEHRENTHTTDRCVLYCLLYLHSDCTLLRVVLYCFFLKLLLLYSFKACTGTDTNIQRKVDYVQMTALWFNRCQAYVQMASLWSSSGRWRHHLRRIPSLRLAQLTLLTSPLPQHRYHCLTIVVCRA